MIKYVTAIILTFLVADTFSITSCPLGDINQQTEDIAKMVGIWRDYQKTSDFLTTITCFTYNFNCPNDTNCQVDIIKNESKQESNELTKNEMDIKWGTEIIYINLDTESKYAILWNCEEKDEETQYQLAILMKNVTDETVTKKIQDLFANINVTYKSDPKIIDYEACSDARMLTISIVMTLIVALSSLF